MWIAETHHSDWSDWSAEGFVGYPPSVYSDHVNFAIEPPAGPLADAMTAILLIAPSLYMDLRALLVSNIGFEAGQRDAWEAFHRRETFALSLQAASDAFHLLSGGYGGRVRYDEESGGMRIAGDVSAPLLPDALLAGLALPVRWRGLPGRPGRLSLMIAAKPDPDGSCPGVTLSVTRKLSNTAIRQTAGDIALAMHAIRLFRIAEASHQRLEDPKSEGCRALRSIAAAAPRLAAWLTAEHRLRETDHDVAGGLERPASGDLSRSVAACKKW